MARNELVACYRALRRSSACSEGDDFEYTLYYGHRALLPHAAILRERHDMSTQFVSQRHSTRHKKEPSFTSG